MNQKQRILIVEDEEPLRRLFEKRISRKGSIVDCYGSAEEALPLLGKVPYDVALVDIKLPGMDGIDLLRRIRQESPSTEVIIITGHGTIDSAIAAMKSGAYDYLTKPCKLIEIELMIQKAMEKKALAEANLNLREELRLRTDYGDVVCRSKKMKDLMALLRKVAHTSSTVLIEGETGTGKELLANAIHRDSARRDHSFIVIHCAALPETLQESELFGYERGAFTGAVKPKRGLVELANCGTLLIDEVGELSSGLQVKLLRFLETSKFRHLGGEQELRIDVRVIAATNRDLLKDVQDGRFREDLYYRLNVVKIRLPPLRERKEDIPSLCDHFLAKLGSRKKMSKEAIMALTHHDWPGNVRELANVIEFASMLTSKNEISAEDLPLSQTGSPYKTKTLTELEKEHISQILLSCAGNKTKTAKLLGISLRTLYRKIDLYGIP
jgi:DNA-binding NtrC family response regulator